LRRHGNPKRRANPLGIGAEAPDPADFVNANPDQQRAAAELDDADLRATRMAQLGESLVGMLGHDRRNPSNGIRARRAATRRTSPFVTAR
jgi:hypothetical protein